ncbi:MAG TPA: hypothetical protein VGQ48_11880 [Gemmatimonadales bacterium]|jgi:hypothetical protein|nr:hypothetical protein [Gemmatimonadales bacterium]
MRVRVTMVLLALAAVTACNDAGTGPLASPTSLQVMLSTPQSDDGAVVITLRGPDVSDLQPATPAYLAYTRSAGTQEARIIVLGNLTAGPLVTLTIGPGHKLSDYLATIEQVATRADALRGDISGYRLTVTPRP